MHFLQSFGVGAIGERLSNQVRDLQHFLFFHAARCDSGRTDADAARFENWIGIEWNAVFVYCDGGPVENFLCFFSVNFLWPKIDEHQMIIGASGDDAVTMFG